MIINVKKINEDAIIPIFAHPTDSGFFSMACAIGEVFETILKK